MYDSSRKRMMVVTFFSSLFSGILVCISLVSDHWIESKPWRKRNPLESYGRIHFGLLHGKKELNVAFGLRPYDLTVPDMIEKDPEFMSRSLWCITLISTSMALLSSGLASLLAVVNTIITPQIKIFSIFGIYTSNLFAVVMCSTSISTWFIIFHTKLYQNVLPMEDLDNFWTSEGASMFGFSFWLLLIAGAIHSINVVSIKWYDIIIARKRRQPLECLEKESINAIMLY